MYLICKHHANNLALVKVIFGKNQQDLVQLELEEVVFVFNEGDIFSFDLSAAETELLMKRCLQSPKYADK
jgi:hypothetical protein